MTKDEALLEYTGRDSRYWVEWVQDRIKQYFDDDPTNPHPECDVAEWMTDLIDEVCEQHRRWMMRPLPARRFERFRKPRSRQPYDENMSSAFIVALVLGTWTMRLSRVKAYDPRRPVALRKRALEGARQRAAALVDGIYDETSDPAYFYLPSWDNPVAPDAIDGDFV